MPRRALLLIVLFVFATVARAQENDFAVYTAEGEPASLDSIAVAMSGVDVVFLGEQHDDPVAHALQARLFEEVLSRYGSARPVALSLEMFERDVQPILDEYLDSLITERHFLASARPWQNYREDYRPMVEAARVAAAPVLAANAPRRYVNRVSRLGPSALRDLPAEARPWLPPLPYPAASEAYTQKFARTMREAMAAMQPDSAATPAAHDTSAVVPAMHGLNHMLDAQALWDASMAHALARHLMAQPDALVLHVAGAFHVAEDLGTPEVLRRYRPGTRSLVVVMQPAEDVARFDAAEHAGLGDFVILTDASQPRSAGGMRF